jgi:flagellar basal-body rod modification protein FlgD
MIVSSSSTQTSLARESSSDARKSGIDYDSFLKLLIATVQNQDPTQPNDPAETLSQLASFSTVEQSIKLNQKLESLLAISSAGQAASLIGKTVSSLDGSTSGVARSVEMSTSGLVVILEGGTRLSVNDGLRIS